MTDEQQVGLRSGGRPRRLEAPPAGDGLVPPNGPDPQPLERGDVEAALAEAARAQRRPYYDAAADATAAASYYRGATPDTVAELVTRSHVRKPAYKPARELYPWVDLQPNGRIRSLYTGHEWTPEELIRADLAIAEARVQQMSTRLAQRSVQGGTPEAADAAAEQAAEVEAALPFNCEHVIPQSWFARKEPMRGDLHHLFACDARCNSFRGNTPYAEFADFPPPTPPADPALQAVRHDCGKSAGNGFEPALGKGAAARAALYFQLRYPTLVDPGEMPPERWRIVLSWHEQNPVTDWERHRNAAIFDRQGNRNPFIDHPEWARTLLPA